MQSSTTTPPTSTPRSENSWRHLTQNWDINAAAHGRVVIGLPIDNPAL
jgi:hypothetical protein